jgi:simple sugar transport system substrate-binding protein
VIKKIVIFATLLFTGLGANETPQKQVAICTHNVRTTTFWNIAFQGIQDAAEDMNVTPLFYGAYDPSIKNLPDYIYSAIDENPAGLIISIPDPELLKAPVKAALDQGIRVIAMNAGFNSFKDLGIKNFVGENHYQTGIATGQRLILAGITKLLLIRTSDIDSAVDKCIKGIKDALKEKELLIKTVKIRDFSPATASAVISTELAIDSSFDGVLAMSSTTALPTIFALEERQLYGNIKFATFDLSEKIKEGIKDGSILFTVSQQPYMEGYLAMALAASPPDVNIRTLLNQLNRRTGRNFFPKGSIPYQSYTNPSNVIYTGPMFITADMLTDEIKFQ